MIAKRNLIGWRRVFVAWIVACAMAVWMAVQVTPVLAAWFGAATPHPAAPLAVTLVVAATALKLALGEHAERMAAGTAIVAALAAVVLGWQTTVVVLMVLALTDAVLFTLALTD